MVSTPYGPKMDHFWDGISQKEIRYRKCNSCNTNIPSGCWICPECWSDDLGWETASGAAVVWSFVVYHRMFSPERTEPYNVVLVDLDEGVRFVATVDCPNDDLYVGMPVQAEFFEENGEQKLKFIPTKT